MLRRGALVVVLLCALVVPARAQAPVAPTTVPPPPPPPKAWVLVDADTGAVIDGGNDRTPLRVASIFKLMTALVVAESVLPGADVAVSTRAESMPARKINLKAGQVWRYEDLMHCLLLISANDAAVALAEHAAGSLEQFAGLLDAASSRLGLADAPVLRDPAGLDDEFSVGGGNLVSARDMAVVARAFLARPELVEIVRKPEYRFGGGDGHPHRLVNHVRLLKTYPGALGLKTGYTKRAGHSLAAAAQRDGRTMVAVVIGAADPYGSASRLLDKGFATPVSAQGLLERLPPVPGTEQAASVSAASVEPAARPVSTPQAPARESALSGDAMLSLALLLVGGTPAVVILARRARRRRLPPPPVELWRT